jgi:hypothetical protein
MILEPNSTVMATTFQTRQIRRVQQPKSPLRESSLGPSSKQKRHACAANNRQKTSANIKNNLAGANEVVLMRC